VLVIGLYAALTNGQNCQDKVEEVERVGAFVKPDLVGLNVTPFEMIDVCDSGGRPYLQARVRGTREKQITTHLKSRGWRVIERYEDGDETFQKMVNGTTVHAWTRHHTEPVRRITIGIAVD
jgi:hypothetical protein